MGLGTSGQLRRAAGTFPPSLSRIAQPSQAFLAQLGSSTHMVEFEDVVDFIAVKEGLQFSHRGLTACSLSLSTPALSHPTSFMGKTVRASRHRAGRTRLVSPSGLGFTQKVKSTALGISWKGGLSGLQVEGF